MVQFTQFIGQGDSYVVWFVPELQQKKLTAAEALLNGLYIKSLLNEVNHALPMVSTVDSRSVQALGTSVKEPEERYNNVNLAAI